MNRKVNLSLIHRYLSGECTSSEEVYIRKWMDADPANREAIDKLQKIWDVQPRKEVESDIQAAWKRLEARMGQNERVRPVDGRQSGRGRSRRRSARQTSSAHVTVWLRVAAVLLIAAFVGIMSHLFHDAGDTQRAPVADSYMMKELVTEKGEKAQVRFSDGSKVILNSAGSLQFQETFGAAGRNVHLDGEAYFEVVHDAGRPFIVHTADAKIEVLGTEFNIQAWGEDGQSEVTVREGKVAVSSAHELENPVEVVLSGGEFTRVQRGENPTSARRVDVAKTMLWINGGLYFDNVPFQQLLRTIERRFDVQIRVAVSELMDVSYTGTFHNAELDKVLSVIAAAMEVEYSREGPEVEFK